MLMRGQTQHRVLLSAAAVAGALAIAACGSSPGKAGSRGSAVVRFSACMRSHGVPEFPDPTTNSPAPNGMGIDGYTFNLPTGLSAQSPAFENAQNACSSQLSVGNGHPPPGMAARARRAALSHSQCMRSHGVPNFPDPQFSGSGGSVTVTSGGSPSLRTPAFLQAQKACAPR